MSDIFDHEADAWDSYERTLDGGDYFANDYHTRRPHPSCRRCGKRSLKWALNDNGRWQLHEQERGEHNRNVPHQCDPTTPDDFEVLD